MQQNAILYLQKNPASQGENPCTAVVNVLMIEWIAPLLYHCATGLNPSICSIKTTVTTTYKPNMPSALWINHTGLLSKDKSEGRVEWMGIDWLGYS
jgi:hypothetical protein